MALVRLIYASRAVEAFTSAQLVALTTRASRSNAAAGVTGTLIYTDGHFLQLLEGNELAVRNLFARIHGDRRHTDVHKIGCQATTARLFGKWGMSCLHEDSIDNISHARLALVFAQVAAAATTQKLGREAHRLLKDLRAAIGEQTRLACVPLAA
jgi:hypothetical protein